MRLLLIRFSRVLVLICLVLQIGCAGYTEISLDLDVEQELRRFGLERAATLGVEFSSPGTIIYRDGPKSLPEVLCDWNEVLLEKPVVSQVVDEDLISAIEQDLKFDLARSEILVPIAIQSLIISTISAANLRQGIRESVDDTCIAVTRTYGKVGYVSQVLHAVVRIGVPKEMLSLEENDYFDARFQKAIHDGRENSFLLTKFVAYRLSDLPAESIL